MRVMQSPLLDRRGGAKRRGGCSKNLVADLARYFVWQIGVAQIKILITTHICSEKEAHKQEVLSACELKFS